MVKVLTVTLNPALDKFVELASPVHRLNHSICHVTVFPGGKGVNVTRALKSLGMDSIPFVAVGGENGRELVKGLKTEKFKPLIFKIHGETRINTTYVSEASRVIRRTLESGPRWSRREVEGLRKVFSRIVRKMDVVVFSGSLPPGVPKTLYREFIQESYRLGVLACLDTSGPALRAGIKAQPFLIKPNLQEAREMIGQSLRSRGDIRKALQFFSGHGMKKVILTLGRHGLVGSDSSGMYRITGKSLQGQTVGCGDAALAGALVG